MLFSSSTFIFLFLPLVLFGYFFLNGRRWITAGKLWLVLTSLFFYGYWEIKYLPLILGSILVNYMVGTRLARSHPVVTPTIAHYGPFADRRTLLFAGIAANLMLLGYFKYTDFFISNTNALFGLQWPLQHIVLPLAISFFTFTQIVYLVDSYRGETAAYDLLNYALFVTFFPHLIAGPIVHHRQIMPQFFSVRTLAWRHLNVLRGLFIFSLGLFKKVVIADTFAGWADLGFDGTHVLDFVSAWVASLSYTFQLYFDFSGYCDMAIGVSLLFNIWLPINFNSPYKALSIQDFWRRWHITLSSFLRDYLYIPLGGNRGAQLQTYFNLFLTFVLGGLWHGATWMFVIWGAMHGVALGVHRLWSGFKRPLPDAVALLLTFLFVNVAWVFFRAKDMDAASRVLRGMVDIGSIQGSRLEQLPTSTLAWGGRLLDAVPVGIPLSAAAQLPALMAIAMAFWICSRPNTIELAQGQITRGKLTWAGILLVLALYATLTSASQVFLYFNF